MPTENQLEAAAVTLADRLVRLGYEVEETRGPSEQTTDGETTVTYHLFANKSDSSFYIRFDSQSRYGVVVYPFNVAASIGSRVEPDDMASILGENEVDPADTRTQERVGTAIIERTPSELIEQPAYQLLQTISAPMVTVRSEKTDGGFPILFSSMRGIFPYEDTVPIRELNDRIETAITAGRKGRLYVNRRLTVDQSGTPAEYTLTTRW